MQEGGGGAKEFRCTKLYCLYKIEKKKRGGGRPKQTKEGAILIYANIII